MFYLSIHLHSLMHTLYKCIESALCKCAFIQMTNAVQLWETTKVVWRLMREAIDEHVSVMSQDEKRNS